MSYDILMMLILVRLEDLSPYQLSAKYYFLPLLAALPADFFWCEKAHLYTFELAILFNFHKLVA